MATEQPQWHWQEPNTAWKGIGIYHITLTITDRRPLLGKLSIPNKDPKQARIDYTELGNKCKIIAKIFGSLTMKYYLCNRFSSGALFN